MIQSKILQRLFHPSSLYTQGYGSFESIGSKIKITYTKNGKIQKKEVNLDNATDLEERIKSELGKLILEDRHKLIATNFSGKESYETLSPKLWLDEDIVSFLANNKNQTIKIEEDLRRVASNFDENNIAKVKLSEDNEVKVKDLISLTEYKRTCSQKEFQTLTSLVNKFKGKRLIFISSTPQGGGVAIMRHGLIRLFRVLNVNAHWYVVKPDADVFNITKRKFHNVLQAAAKPGIELTKADEKLYNKWIRENADFFKDKFKKADFVVIDDPQPSGLIPYIRKANPKAKIIYRSHIHIETDLTKKIGTPQYKTWQFLWKNIKLADVFISHPVASFVPMEVPKEKVVFMPATTDPLDGLNKPLNEHYLNYYMDIFDKFTKAENQTPLDHKRPYIIQIARFDPSKGIPYVLDAYRTLRKKFGRKSGMLPQLVITGNGSIDDPERNLIFDETIEKINSPEFAGLKDDIKVVRLPHIDQMFNALLRRSAVVLQLSTKEGFEIKVTEALMKGKPVIAFKTGGIPLQIKDGVDGFLVKTGNSEEVASHLFELLTDSNLYVKMSKAAESYFDKSFLTIPNATRWLELCLRLGKT